MIREHMTITAFKDRVDYPIYTFGFTTCGYETVHISERPSGIIDIQIDICDYSVASIEDAIDAAWGNNTTLRSVREIADSAAVGKYVLLDGQTLIYVQVLQRLDLALITQASHETFRTDNWTSNEVFKDFWEEQYEIYERHKRDLEIQKFNERKERIRKAREARGEL